MARIGFPVALAEKDFGYARAATRRSGAPVARAAHEMFRRAMRKGLGDRNLTSVATLVRRQAQ